jgi:hypothetical protein
MIPMDVECRTYRYLNGDEDAPRLGTAIVRIGERPGHGYEVAFTRGNGECRAHAFPSLPEARKLVEETVARAEAEIRRAECEARYRVLYHPWWQAPVQKDDLDRILELASIHPEGVILIDPWGGYAWAPPESWHTGRHLRLPIPPEGHCTASAAFALVKALEDALQLTCQAAPVS